MSTLNKLKLYTLDELLLENKPEQFELLDELVELFAKNKSLAHALVRGSIAKNTFDRVSDLDLVLAFDDRAYANAVNGIDALLSSHFKVLFPGWHDAIVADFGGLGFVYLIERNGKIFQADIYLIPEHRSAMLSNLAKSKLIYRRSATSASPAQGSSQADPFIADFRAKPKDLENSLVETLIISSLIAKRIKRSQEFLNYSETHLLNCSIRNFLRAQFDPGLINYGWYHIEDSLSRVPEHRKWLSTLRGLILSRSTHDLISLSQTMNIFLEMVRDLAPSLHKKHAESIDLYYKNIGFI